MTTVTCKHCKRPIVKDPHEGWIDPEAGYDDEDGDGMWRTTCDDETRSELGGYTADHEPAEVEAALNATPETWYVVDRESVFPLVGPFYSLTAAQGWITDACDSRLPNRANGDDFGIEQAVAPATRLAGIRGGTD